MQANSWLTRISNWLAWFLVLTLSATFLLKLWAFFTNPFLDIHLGIPQWLVILSIVLELATILAICSARRTSSKLLISFVFFVAVSIYSLLRLLNGQSSCGCAGDIEIPSWLVLTFDLSVVSVIVLLMFASQVKISEIFIDFQQELRSKDSKWWGKTLGFALFGCLLVVAHAPSISTAIDKILFDKLVSAKAIHLGNLTTGNPVKCSINVKNDSDSQVELLGFEASCTCVAVHDTTILIEPGTDKDIEVVVRPIVSGVFRQRLTCFVGGVNQNTLILEVFGDVQ